MSKKKQLFSIFIIQLLFLASVNSQNFNHAVYQMVVDNGVEYAKIVADYSLDWNSDFSLFKPIGDDSQEKLAYLKDLKVLSNENGVVELEAPDRSRVKSYTDYHVTNLKDRVSYFNLLIFNSIVDIKKPLDRIEWDITSTTVDDVFGEYKLQKAYGRFMGRDYVVLFAPDIVTNAAPHKFHGLPGMIVSLKSLDGFVELNLIEIKNSNESTNKYLNFIPEDSISWDEYKVRLRDAAEKSLRRAVSRLNSGGNSNEETTYTIEFTNTLEIPNIKPVEVSN